MKRAKIMVVEDEGIVAADIQDRLRALGYGVAAVVDSGKEAEPTAGSSRPDLVLMDILLKGDIDGVQAAERIRTNLDIPVVFLTAHADETTLQRAKITAPFGYILKPFGDRELHTTIEIALFRHAIEAKLKKTERWLSAVLESIGGAVVATDKWGLITLMILVRVQGETNYPRPGADAPHPIMVRSQPWQASFQGSHHPGHV
jgi:CheY-like chemotaxis protein